MSKAKFEAAKELIQEKQYDQARAILKTIDHPQAKDWLVKLDRIAPEPLIADDPFDNLKPDSSQSPLPPGVTAADRANARMKSYTPHVVVVIVLYFILFIPGLIANVIFHEEGKRMEVIAGQPLPGVGALGLMRKWLFIIIVVLSAIVIGYLLIGLLALGR